MSNRVSVGLILLSAAALVAWGAGAGRSGGDDVLQLPQPAVEYLLVSPALVGVSSCTSTACHNRQTPGTTCGNEYAIWADCDPHARAYQALFNDRSRRMVRNLYGPDALPAEKTALCLKCHATTEPATPAVDCRYLGDGVGCESCHGPAKKWLTLHYQGRGST